LESACAFILRVGSRTLSTWNSCVSHLCINVWQSQKLNYVVAGEGMSKTASKYQKLWRQQSILPTTFRGSLALLTPWFWTSTFQNYEKINFICFKLPVYCHGSSRRLIQESSIKYSKST
jgi:hypothetical protein